jgi:group I intron endonuclease
VSSTERVSGIYQIRNLVNGKLYVGRSTNVKRRFHEHKVSLRKGTHANAHLQNAWGQYGTENFVFELIERVDNLDLLAKREGFHCERLGVFDSARGYNLDRVDEEGRARPSEETRAKIRASHLGLEHTPETCQKLSNAQRALHTQRIANGTPHPNRGAVRSEESRRRQSELRKGVPLSSETRAKMSAAKKGHPPSQVAVLASVAKSKGVPRTAEVREKISVAQKGRAGRPHTEAFKQMVGRIHRGKVLSEETRRKLQGRVVSEETRQRLRDSALERTAWVRSAYDDRFADILFSLQEGD